MVKYENFEIEVCYLGDRTEYKKRQQVYRDDISSAAILYEQTLKLLKERGGRHLVTLRRVKGDIYTLISSELL